jgi:hypothetical protein
MANRTITLSSTKQTSLVSKNHPFIRAMELTPEFVDVPPSSEKLSTPPSLDLERRTWIQQNGEGLFSVFYLSDHHAGYHDIGHGGLIALVIDHILADYCNLLSPTHFALTTALSLEYLKPTPLGTLIIARVNTEPPGLLTRFLTKKWFRKTWLRCELCIYKGGDLKPVVKAKAEFTHRKSLPKLPSCDKEVQNIDMLPTRKEEVGFDFVEISAEFFATVVSTFVLVAVIGLWVAYRA